MTKLEDILTFEEVAQILRIIEAAPRGGEVNIRLGEASLQLRLAEPHAPHGHHGIAHATPTPPVTAASPKAPSPERTVAQTQASSPKEKPSAPESAKTDREGWVDIRSPMVGIFYRAPSPSEPPFVEVGDLVEEGQQVGIIEVMKLMNRITAPCAGTVREICVENGQLAGFDAPLMWIEPAEPEA
jgi:acetyl-CoA carboxylase biotin carboxyl carrier protein